MCKFVFSSAVLAVISASLAGCMTDKEATVTDPRCHDQAVATGSAAGAGVGALGVLTVGGILPGIVAGNVVSDKVEDNCLAQKKIAQKSDQHSQ